MPSVKGRAHTLEQKEAVLRRLLRAWENMPDLRLGQLIVNSLVPGTTLMFYVEDEDLASSVERFSFGGESDLAEPPKE